MNMEESDLREVADMRDVDDTLTRNDMHIVDDRQREIFTPSWFGYSPLPKTISRYPLTLDQYDELRRLQDGNCAVCEREEFLCGPLVIDHDHATRQVRGLVCQPCNRGLGQFDDDPTRLEAAASYLWRRGCWLNRPLTDEERVSFDEMERDGIITSEWRRNDAMSGRQGAGKYESEATDA